VPRQSRDLWAPFKARQSGMVASLNTRQAGLACLCLRPPTPPPHTTPPNPQVPPPPSPPTPPHPTPPRPRHSSSTSPRPPPRPPPRTPPYPNPPPPPLSLNSHLFSYTSKKQPNPCCTFLQVHGSRRDSLSSIYPAVSHSASPEPPKACNPARRVDERAHRFTAPHPAAQRPTIFDQTSCATPATGAPRFDTAVRMAVSCAAFPEKVSSWSSLGRRHCFRAPYRQNAR